MVTTRSRLSFLKGDIFWVAIPRQPRGQMIFRVEQAGISGIGREQRQGVDCDPAAIMCSGAALDATDLMSSAPTGKTPSSSHKADAAIQNIVDLLVAA